MSSEFVTVVMFAGMAGLLLTGQRVYGAIGFVGAVAAILLWGDGGVEMAFNAAFKLMNWYPLLTLPLFIFMGYMLADSGIAEDLYRMFHVWSGGLRGGLALGTIGLMVLISALNGLSVAGMAIGASIALPEMLRRGYDKRMITGVVQAGSSLGILIPPSVVLVLFAMIAREPVTKLWLAGILPGLLMAAIFAIYILVRNHLQPELGPPLSNDELARYTFRDKLKLLSAGVLPLLIFVVMMGLFISGITSLVESSAVGAAMATLGAIVRKRFKLQLLDETLRKTLSISAMFMWIIMAALCFGAVYDGLGAVKAIENLVLGSMGLDPWTILILMLLSFIIMGVFLDDTAMLIIVAPLYVPLVRTLGFDLIWFGILYTVTCQIAYITPPFGYNLFLMKAMAPKEITLKDIYSSVIPFFLLMVATIILLLIYPQITLWLPSVIDVK